MNGYCLKELVQREVLVQEREDAVQQREEMLRMREEVVEKREVVATMRENAVKGREVALEEKGKALKKREGVLKKKEEELSEQEQALKKPDKGIKRIRTSAAGSSSLPRQPPPPGPATQIHQLPDKVLERIFTLLSPHTLVQVLSVCQRWRSVIEDRCLIKKLKFENHMYTTQEALCLIHSARQLKSLELIWRSDAVALLDAVSTRCTNLLHLSVENYNLSVSLTDVLRKVFLISPHITNLRLMYTSPCDSLRFYEELGALLPDLRKLEFHIDRLCDFQLDALIDSFSRHQMEEFKANSTFCSKEHIAKLVQFWGCSLRVLELNAFDLPGASLARLAGCSELRRLELDQLEAHSDWLYRLTALSQLEELCVSHSLEYKHQNWCSFFSRSRSSHRFRKISLKGGTEVNDKVLASVARNCLELEELEVFGMYVTISGIRRVLQCCRKLHNLTFQCTDYCGANIVPELPQLAPQLRRICIGFDEVQSLDKATLRRVQAQMPHLRIQ